MDYSDIDEEFRDFVSDDEGDTFVEPAFENERARRVADATRSFVL